MSEKYEDDLDLDLDLEIENDEPDIEIDNDLEEDFNVEVNDDSTSNPDDGHEESEEEYSYQDDEGIEDEYGYNPEESDSSSKDNKDKSEMKSDDKKSPANKKMIIGAVAGAVLFSVAAVGGIAYMNGEFDSPQANYTSAPVQTYQPVQAMPQESQVGAVSEVDNIVFDQTNEPLQEPLADSVPDMTENVTAEDITAEAKESEPSYALNNELMLKNQEALIEGSNKTISYINGLNQNVVNSAEMTKKILLLLSKNQSQDKLTQVDNKTIEQLEKDKFALTQKNMELTAQLEKIQLEFEKQRIVLVDSYRSIEKLKKQIKSKPSVSTKSHNNKTVAKKEAKSGWKIIGMSKLAIIITKDGQSKFVKAGELVGDYKIHHINSEKGVVYTIKGTAQVLFKVNDLIEI